MDRQFNSDLPFSKLAEAELGNTQLRTNLARATTTIREKRLRVVGEVENWEDLRSAGALIKDYVLDHLDELAVKLETNVTRRGGVVHWARTAAEANDIVVELVKATSSDSVVKVKSMVTQEIELNRALERNGIAAYETDLAELIVQLGHDLPSHILVPAIHKNRTEIRDIFINEMGRSGLAAPQGLTDSPQDLAAAARAHLRDRFLNAKVAISGANFLLADSGGLVIVESEGNGRMCVTLPDTLISVVGVEKILPDWQSLGVFMQLLPRSSTGERMNPYTSVFTGITPGDGPQQFHLVLLDNGRTTTLADPDGREVLRCIRCSACLNVCPVYERTGGHAYGNPYPGPIGAVLVPQLRKDTRSALEDSLPFASTLCGACYEVCPVKIEIPRILVKLRTDIVNQQREQHPYNVELLGMKAVDAVFSSPRRFRWLLAFGELVSRLTSRTSLHHLPPPLNQWSQGRDSPLPPRQSFRAWFKTTHVADQTSSMSTPAVERDLATEPPRHLPTSRGDARAEMLHAMSTNHRTTEESFDRLGASPSKGARRLSASHRISLLRDRLIDYRANVVESSPEEIGTHVRELLALRDSTRIVVPTDLPESWTAEVEGTVRHDAPPLTTAELDSLEATVSGCAVAIAESGTIILDAGPRQGRRVISLLPDHLIVVVEANQVVDSVVEGIARLNPESPQTWISGPSATSDIELERIEGVHGPRVLDVIIVTPAKRRSPSPVKS